MIRVCLGYVLGLFRVHKFMFMIGLFSGFIKVSFVFFGFVQGMFGVLFRVYLGFVKVCLWVRSGYFGYMFGLCVGFV